MKRKRKSIFNFPFTEDKKEGAHTSKNIYKEDSFVQQNHLILSFS